MKEPCDFSQEKYVWIGNKYPLTGKISHDVIDKKSLKPLGADFKFVAKKFIKN